MKIHFDIDATPQELRTFFGLPNIESLQNEMVDIIRKNMSSGIEGFDPATVMKLFLPEQMQAVTALQKNFWQSMMGQSQTSSNEDKRKTMNET
jgi:hypothetical protein